MHIAMFFWQLKSSVKYYTYFSNVKQRANFQNSNSVFGVCKSYSRLHFWLNNQAFVIALNKVPKNRNMFWQCFWKKNIDVDVFDDVLQNSKHRAYDASNDVNHQPLPGGGGQLTGVKCFQAVRVKWVKTPQRKRFYCSIFIFGWKKKTSFVPRGPGDISWS